MCLAVFWNPRQSTPQSYLKTKKEEKNNNNNNNAEPLGSGLPTARNFDVLENFKNKRNIKVFDKNVVFPNVVRCFLESQAAPPSSQV